MPAPSSFRRLVLFIGCLLSGLAQASASLIPLGPGAAPGVAYAVEPVSDALILHLEVAPAGAGFPRPAVQLGVAGVREVFLDGDKHARVSAAEDGSWHYAFTLPAAFLGGDATKAGFRWAFSIDWKTPSGGSLLKQNYFVPSTWAPHRDIGKNASAWATFSVPDYLAARELVTQRITLAFTQPMEGKASVVIESQDGHRVRNLVSGQSFSAGKHELVWDGLDEDGRLAQPGDYRWRAISHPGIEPEFLMHFNTPGEEPWGRYNWLADHSNPTSAAAYGNHVVLGSPLAESGNNIVLADLEGNKITGVSLSSFIGIGRLHLALGPDRIYALSEGRPHYDAIRKDADGTPFFYGDLSLVAWDYTGRQQRYQGKNGEHLVRTYSKPLDTPSLSIRTSRTFRTDNKNLLFSNLRGAVWLGGKLYLSLHDENRIAVIDPADGSETGGIMVEAPGPITTDGRALYVLGKDGTQIFRVDAPGDGAEARGIFNVGLSAPLPYARRNGDAWPVATSLAINSKGELCLADNGGDQNIKVYSPAGRLLREIGPRGGRAPRGTWQPDAISKPSGLVFDARDRLWLAEDEEAPRRISLWDTSSGSVTQEIFGPPPYGGTGAGFDHRDASRWFGAGSVWNIDLRSKVAKLDAVLHHKVKANQLGDTIGGNSIQVIHHQDRTFLLAKGRVLQVIELLPDGGARLWAAVGSLRGFELIPPQWTVPEVFTRHPALRGELAGFDNEIGEFGDLRNHTEQSRQASNYTVLWTDANADEVAQVEELQVSGPSGPRLILPYWTTVQAGLDLEFPVQAGMTWSRGTLRLHDFLPSGAPDWRLGDAYSSAIPFKDFLPSEQLQATLTDSLGRLVFNTTPMTAVDPDGGTRWSMRNDWAGVHASHQAPLPETGVIQGALGFLGRAPFDTEGDITVINGNRGRFYALTTDGIYLDDFFEDVRVSLARSPFNVGSEPFGGYFARDEKTGRFLLQAGHGAFRIYEIKGLDKLVRSSGNIQVSAAQLIAAEKLHTARVARDLTRREATVRTVRPEVSLGDDPSAWPGGWSAEWGDATRPFPHARIKLFRQADTLVLGYDVKDPTPWLNKGTARNLLFKTGDAVDFQFSIDPSATATRTDPVAGDRRLLIANHENKPVAVLYDYLVPGTAAPVLFNSPWRSTKVDRVEVVASADIQIQKTGTGYTVIARIPLSALGLPAKGVDELRGDFGVIYGDDAGEKNVLRSYWANPVTGLVDDVPGETQLNPSLWGILRLE